MKTRKLISCISCILICILCLALGCAVFAAPATGTVTVRVETLEGDVPIPGYKLHLAHVAEADGSFIGDFAGAGLDRERMLDQSANSSNAKALFVWAQEKSVVGTEAVCDDGGEVRFEGLESGIYMVWAAEDNELSFLPFLVYMPTVVNGEADWDVLALPKAEEDPQNPQPTPTPTPEPTPTPTPGTTSPPSPSDPPTPGVTPTPGPGVTPTPGPEGPSVPSLPQTGINRLPSTLLFVFGIAFAVLGTVLIIRGGEPEKETEDE